VRKEFESPFLAYPQPRETSLFGNKSKMIGLFVVKKIIQIQFF